MKKITNVLNIITLVLIAAVGAAMIPQAIALGRAVTEPSGYSELLILWIYPVVLLVLDFAFFVTGVLFPKEMTYPDEKKSAFLSFISKLNMIVNKRVMNAAAVEGKTPWMRFWEPTSGMVWLIVQGAMGVFAYFVGNYPIRILCIISMALIALHMIISFFWKMAWSKENYGSYSIKGTLIPMVCVLAFFAAAAGIGIARSNAKEQNDYISAQEIHERVEEAKERAAQPGKKLSMEEVIAYIRADMDTADTIFYKLKETDDGADSYITFVVWTDSGDDVFWYRFLVDGDDYYYDSRMQSETMKKAELVGTEDGILQTNTNR